MYVLYPRVYACMTSPPHTILENFGQQGSVFYIRLEQFLIIISLSHIKTKGPDGILGDIPIHFPIIKPSKLSHKLRLRNCPASEGFHGTIPKKPHKCNCQYPCNLSQTEREFTQNSKLQPLPGAWPVSHVTRRKVQCREKCCSSPSNLALEPSDLWASYKSLINSKVLGHSPNASSSFTYS